MYCKEYTTVKAGTKGALVMEALEGAGPEGLTRKALAESVGCTVARVGEVLRALGDAVTKVGGSAYALAEGAQLPPRVEHRSNFVPTEKEAESTAPAPAPAPQSTKKAASSK